MHKTRARISRLIAATSILALVIGFAVVDVAYADDVECTQGTTVPLSQCVAAQLKDVEEKLLAQFSEALANVPERSPSALRDPRQATEQLKQELTDAQKAWEEFTRQSCAYAGGIQGGSLIWINIFDMECRIQAVKARIEALKHLPHGT